MRFSSGRRLVSERESLAKMKITPKFSAISFQ